MLRKIRKTDKRAISEMVAYVILISIALGLAVGVYSYWSVLVNIAKSPLDCKEGTSVSLENYSCDDVLQIITLKIKNTGRFDVDGIIAKFGEDPNKEPVSVFDPFPIIGAPGHFSFDLKTGESKEAKFKRSNSFSSDYIKVVEIQPFVIMDKRKVVCTNSVIKEPLSNPDCKVK